MELRTRGRLLVQRLLKLAPQVRITAISVGANVQKDKVIGQTRAALEKQTISQNDLQILLGQPPQLEEMLRLDNGYWLQKSDVARECECQCERENCVENMGKVHCYFSRALSEWVISVGLYWKCYDETISCPRCGQLHKRGHIGRAGTCGLPYRDQAHQTGAV